MRDGLEGLLGKLYPRTHSIIVMHDHAVPSAHSIPDQSNRYLFDINMYTLSILGKNMQAICGVRFFVFSFFYAKMTLATTGDDSNGMFTLTFHIFTSSSILHACRTH